MVANAMALAAWACAALLTVLSVRALRAATVGRPAAGEGCVSLSVIVAAHNEAPRIGALVESVLSQDHPNFELLIVDDGSTDGTLAAASEAAHGDPRVQLLRVDARPPGWQGRMHAQSIGEASARCEWLLFLSADQRLVDSDFFRAILAEYARRGVAAASVLGPFVGDRWWQTWWLRPIAENPVLLGCVFLLQRLRPDATWLIGALAMPRETYRTVGGAASAALFGAGVFDDWGWTRVFELRRLRTAMVYHTALHDVSNWTSFGDCWSGLSRWAAGILTSRGGAWAAAVALSAAALLCTFATGRVVIDLLSLRLPAIAWTALAAIPPTVGVAHCLWHGYRAWWAALSAPIALWLLTPLAGGVWARVRNRIRWHDQELLVVADPPADRGQERSDGRPIAE